MSETLERYECLSGSFWKPVGPGAQQLWLGQSHLLLLMDRGYVERHKKLYLKDIQALTLTPTFQGSFISILFALACLILLGLFLTVWVNETEEGMYFMGVAASLAATGLLINLLLGPTCKCHIHTATQMQRLTCLSRTRRARRVLSTLADRIEAAQSNEAQDA